MTGEAAKMQDSGKLCLNAKETAAILGLSKSSIYQGVSTGEIPHIKVGKRILIPRFALEKMLAEAGMNQKED